MTVPRLCRHLGLHNTKLLYAASGNPLPELTEKSPNAGRPTMLATNAARQKRARQRYLLQPPIPTPR